jgi:hypothetical protein
MSMNASKWPALGFGWVQPPNYKDSLADIEKFTKLVALVRQAIQSKTITVEVSRFDP